MRPTRQQDYQVITPKSPERIIKKRCNSNQIQYLIKWKDHDEATWEVEENVRRSILDEFLRNEQQLQEQSNRQAAQSTPVIQQVHQSLKHPSFSEELLLNKQKELTQKFCSSYPQQHDSIDTVQLLLTCEECIFEVKWKPRQDGVIPISDFYQYDQFKLAAPMLFMKFLEICILEQEVNNTEIKFLAPGSSGVERATKIKQILLKNPKYTDANKQPQPVIVEEQKQQEQQIENQQEPRRIIIVQEHSEKKSVIQESQEQERLESLSQPELVQYQQKSVEEREPGEIVDQEEVQVQQNEDQLEQRSISLEPQKE